MNEKARKYEEENEFSGISEGSSSESSLTCESPKKASKSKIKPGKNDRMFRILKLRKDDQLRYNQIEKDLENLP